MKHLAAIILAILGFASANCAPRILWRETVHNFGAFHEDMGPQTAEFRYINIGDLPLVIVQARASCGCTRPEYSRNTVAPGDSGVVRVTYDPTGRPGRFAKKVVVETNATDSRSNLEIRGVVIGSGESVSHTYPADFGPLKAKRGSVMFGEVVKKHLKTVYLEGYNASTDSLHLAIEGLPKYIDVSLVPPVVPPGEQVTAIFYFRGNTVPQYGLVTDTARIVTQPETPGQEYPLELTALVTEDFSQLKPGELAKAPIATISPEIVDMGVLRRSDAGIVEGEFTITNSGQSPLVVRRIYTTDPGIEVDDMAGQQIKKGKTLIVQFRVNPSQLAGALLNSRISVITNAPDAPTQPVRIVGKLED